MKVQVETGITTVGNVSMGGRVSTAPTFSQILDRVSSSLGGEGVLGVGTHAEISALQSELIKGGMLTPHELLFYQIKVGRFGMQVELLSKAAEGLLTAVRKLQGGQ